jgi:hypothetical protein
MYDAYVVHEPFWPRGDCSPSCVSVATLSLSRPTIVSLERGMIRMMDDESWYLGSLDGLESLLPVV